MQRTMKVWWLLAVVAVAGAAGAAEYENEHFSLEVPRGYEGPHLQPDGGGETYLFVKRHLPTLKTAIYQVTIHDLGKAVDESKVAKDRYLHQLLDGIKEKRIELVAQPFEDAMVDARPARAAKWQGNLDGKPLVGHAYVAVSGSKVYMINVQDFEEYATSSMTTLERMVKKTKLVTRITKGKPGHTQAAFRTIEAENLGDHIDARVRLTLKDGRVREGTLRNVQEQSAILLVDSSRKGSLEFTIPFKTMSKAEVERKAAQ